jgi:hypothetical protein
MYLVVTCWLLRLANPPRDVICISGVARDFWKEVTTVKKIKIEIRELERLETTIVCRDAACG